MKETEMGYRGSKSGSAALPVKEQRVDGSYFENKSKLRYTLMDYENNYQIKIPSKQIIHKQYYSSTNISTLYLANTHDNLKKLNPWFITGFTDAEGSFIIRIRKKPKSSVGWVVVAIFSIALHKKDLHILEYIQTYFGGIGKIRILKENVYEFRVESYKQISKVIIPHFDLYPLLTQKKGDYILFSKVIQKMKDKEHMKKEGLSKIVSIKSSINKGLSPELYTAFPNNLPIPRPLVVSTIIQDGNWLSGFASGEGCFKVIVRKSLTTKLGYNVGLAFQITQHSAEQRWKINGKFN